MPAARQLGRPGPDQQIAGGIDLGVHFGIFTDFWVGLVRGWWAVACGDGAGVPFGPSLGGYWWVGDVLIAALRFGLLGRWGGWGAVVAGLARGAGGSDLRPGAVVMQALAVAGPERASCGGAARCCYGSCRPGFHA